MTEFSTRLIAWQRSHGRHDLPWQNTRDPYAIWVSEIMLQQTQVSAVIPYYQRFMTSFPDVATLAAAEEDQVLAHWSGLGYYSRARNLHAAAQKIMREFDGRFPQTPEDLETLPGIGRSTAAAIAVFAYGVRAAILDGNVKRVLTRHFGIEGWPSAPTVEKQLWSLAESLLPERYVEAYTQGLMDLGASLCARNRPNCGACPLKTDCVALREQRTETLPAAKPRKALPERQVAMLMILNGNDILLEKRESKGIWGGLWSFPEIETETDVRSSVLDRFGLETASLATLPILTHTFTHFRLRITPQVVSIKPGSLMHLKAGMLWLDREDALGAALPTPVRKLLNQLEQSGA
jgi:A/G-specific adenine glycosylase